ncbi:MAG: hypothetical protein ACE5I3_14880, partial [Phycisphaerae bacterium]
MDPRWVVQQVSWPREMAAAVREFADTGELAWLDSAVTDDLQTAPARYSLVCRDPVALLEEIDGARAEFLVAGKIVATDTNGWELWRRVLRRTACWPPATWGISPGWVGYVGFEMARHLERLPSSHREDLGLPLLRMELYDRGIVLDHYRCRAFAVAGVGMRSKLGLTELPLEALVEDWEQAVSAESPPRCPSLPRLCFDMDRRTYE